MGGGIVLLSQEVFQGKENVTGRIALPTERGLLSGSSTLEGVMPPITMIGGGNLAFRMPFIRETPTAGGSLIPAVPLSQVLQAL